MAKAPPPDVLQVIDPRPHTVAAAALAARYGLNFLAADLLGAATWLGAAIHAAEHNVGNNWANVCEMEDIELHIIPALDQP